MKYEETWDYSIVIPHYRTPELTTLCVRCINKFKLLRCEVLIVDNSPDDPGIEALRNVPNVRVISNPSAEVGVQAHKKALALGVESARTEWVFLFHSDTIPVKSGWDEKALNLVADHRVVGLTTTIRSVNPFDTFFSKLARRVRERKTYFYSKTEPTDRKVMSYFFLIDKTYFSSERITNDSDDVTVGLYKELCAKGHIVVLAGRLFLNQYIWHSSNATSLLSGQMGNSGSRDRFFAKLSRLEKEL
jgi:GT2 family glycosyltransferase